MRILVTILRSRRRLALIGFFLFIELNVVALSTLALSLATAAVNRNAAEGARRAALGSVVSVEQRLQPMLGLVNDLVAGSDAIGAIRAAPCDCPEEPVSAHLSALINSSSGFRRFFLTDADGRVIRYQPTSPALIGADLADEEWFRQARAPNSQSAALINTRPGAPVGRVADIFKSVPIVGTVREHGVGPAIGYAVGIYDLDQIQSFVNDTAKGAELNLTILGPNGEVIARPGGLSRQGWPSSNEVLVSTKIDDELVRRARGGGVSLIQTQGSRGPVFSAYSSLPGTGWVLITDMPAAQAFDEVESLRSSVGIIGAILGIVLLIGMAIGLRQLSRLQRTALDGQRAEAMSRLNQAARAVHKEVGPTVLDRIVETAQTLTEADLAALVVFAPEGAPTQESFTHRGAAELRPNALPDLIPVLMERFEKEQMVQAADAGELQAAGHGLDQPPLGPLLAIPLRAGQDTLGILAVARPPAGRPFNTDVAELIGELGHHAVTALQKARHDQELEAKNEKLMETSRLKSEFLATMSHELRTPLAAIIGFSQVLLDGLDGRLEKEQEEDIGQINRSGQILLELINGILDLSKIQAGKLQLEMVPLPIADVVNDVIGSLLPLAEAKQLYLRTELAESTPLVLADPLRIRQVLVNLVSNAIKFTDQGGVTVRCDRDREFSVIDTGIGILQADQEKIFDEFTQADGSTTRMFGGTGLGLSISRRLIELQSGTMGVESEPGHGSRFWFTLPPAPATDAIEDLLAAGGRDPAGRRTIEVS